MSYEMERHHRESEDAAAEARQDAHDRFVPPYDYGEEVQEWIDRTTRARLAGEWHPSLPTDPAVHKAHADADRAYRYVLHSLAAAHDREEAWHRLDTAKDHRRKMRGIVAGIRREIARLPAALDRLDRALDRLDEAAEADRRTREEARAEVERRVAGKVAA
jgi:hypothetical protein